MRQLNISCLTSRRVLYGPVRRPRAGHRPGIRRIKAQDGPDLVLWGSSTLTSTLLEHGLADEVVLMVYPVLLDMEKRFFAEETPPRSFRALEDRIVRRCHTRSELSSRAEGISTIDRRLALARSTALGQGSRLNYARNCWEATNHGRYGA